MTESMASKEMGSSGRTFQDLLNFMRAAILRTDVLQQYNILRKNLLEHDKKPNKHTEMAVAKAYQQYALTMWRKHISRLHIRGYKTKFVVFDEDGETYLDSDYLGWKVVSDDALTMIDLVPKKYYERPLAADRCALLYLRKRKQTPYIINRKHPILQLPQSGLMHSQYVADPRETMETVMASVSNVFDHPHETPHYISLRHGMASRPAFPGKGQQGYYVCCNVRVLVADEQGKDNCITSFYIRLGIEQEIDDMFTTMLAHSQCSTCKDGDWSIRAR